MAEVFPILRFRLIRFSIIGGAVALFYVIAFPAFLSIGVGRMSANSLAFLLAVTFQYIGQTTFTFRRQLAVPDQIGRFGAMVCLGLFVSSAITGWLGPTVGWADWVSAAVVAIILPIQNYALLSIWVYSRRKNGFGGVE